MTAFSLKTVLIYIYFVRLKLEVEKQELELFRQGQFVIEDEEKEDAGAPTASTEVPVEVSFFTPFVNSNKNDTVQGC